MQTRNNHSKAVIYALACLCLGKVYIGATARAKERFKEHFALLRRGKHPCEELQEDWDSVGCDCFTILVLETADQSVLSARERAWTKKCVIEAKVYNALNAVREAHVIAFQKHKPQWPAEPVGKSAKEYTFITPTGEEMKVKGLRGICTAYDLNMSHMSKVARKMYVQHRGWTLGGNDQVAAI